ncbi:unnamed protein product [Plutella xylostella]|uniref:(diamondback moth) hypothetical protein n=1 Tax=Plutella xylostella TaxID=51655 RepID=A0A8S4FYD5_PLUXY|nr:unnamed protein product [Plutella xylostella]
MSVVGGRPPLPLPSPPLPGRQSAPLSRPDTTARIADPTNRLLPFTAVASHRVEREPGRSPAPAARKKAPPPRSNGQLAPAADPAETRTVCVRVRRTEEVRGGGAGAPGEGTSDAIT